MWSSSGVKNYGQGNCCASVSLLMSIYRVFQYSTAKLRDRTPHVERRKKVYDNMVPEMHNYRVI
jgi:hypothetical protein